MRLVCDQHLAPGRSADPRQRLVRLPLHLGQARGQLFKRVGQPPAGPTPPVGAALMYGTSPRPGGDSRHINLVDRVLPDGTLHGHRRQPGRRPRDPLRPLPAPAHATPPGSPAPAATADRSTASRPPPPHDPPSPHRPARARRDHRGRTRRARLRDNPSVYRPQPARISTSASRRRRRRRPHSRSTRSIARTAPRHGSAAPRAHALDRRPLLTQLPLTRSGVTIELAGLDADGRHALLTIQHPRSSRRYARAIYRRALRTAHDNGHAYRTRYTP